MKTVIAPLEELERAIAAQVQALLKEKPQASLALTAGRSTDGVYQLLAQMCSRGELSFKEARIFAVTELIDPPGMSQERRLRERLIDMIDLGEGSFFLPPREEPQSYDSQIQTLGGLDLCLLGIGDNGHIGYNEPGTAYDSLTHIQKLTPATHRQHEARGEALPELAVTMGIKTLLSSRRCLLLASGQEKAQAVFKMIYGKTESYVPASFLQIPLEVTAYLDPEAAGKL